MLEERSAITHPAPLLSTKCFIPRTRADLVRRPRLVARLREGLQRPLTLICAPAGFGKTTLLGEWYAGDDFKSGAGIPTHHLAWVALDEGDNDPVRFWRYVATAFESVRPGTSQFILSLLESPQALPIELLLTTLINTLAEPDAASDEIFLVLDDYHAIEASDIHSGIAFLLEHLPPHVHIIIASRVPPPLPMARLRARGQLSEIRAVDLRFTRGEAIELLHSLLGESLPESSLTMLEKQTEGWAAGLQLAALSLRGLDDIPAQIEAFGGTNRLVLDYVAEEILHRQPANVQRFLLHTSILERLTASLCDAVTGDLDGQSMLETLEHESLFLIPLDSEQRWYRYHHLFAHLLFQRLKRTLPEVIPQLHHRAAEWLEHNDLLTSAIPHALASEDYALAVRLIESYFQKMLERSEMTTVRRWLDTLPTAVRKSNASLSLIYAWTLIATGSFTAVEPYLDDVENALATDPTPSPPEIMQAETMRGHVAAIRATAAINTGRKELAQELSLQALAVLPTDEALPRTVAALSLADALYGLNDLKAATGAFTEAYKASLAAGMIPVTLNALSNLGQLYERQGKLHQAAATYERALRIAELHPGFAHFSSKSHIGLARVLREWNNPAAAQAQAQQGIACARQWGHQEHLIDGYLCVADIQWSQGDVTGALATLAEAEPLILQPSAHPEAVARYTSYQASRWILLDRLDEAQHWADSFDAGMEGDARLHKPGILTLARLRLAQGAPDAARILLDQLLVIVERVGLAEDKIHINILLAQAHQAMHSSAQAEQALREALASAETEGYLRTFLDEGPTLASLLEVVASSSGTGARYARILLADLGLSTSPQQNQNQYLNHMAPSTPTPPLTRREQEVLGLIAKGASNQQIAETLVIAIGTVKKHVTTIFAKLGVNSRTQLLARARELGLIQL
jgi:LuxR family transcriptional regulator, maltose regulon positive regulatory protein